MKLWREFLTCSVLTALAIMLSGCSKQPERKVLFDNDWQFRLTTENETRSIDLPHDWSIEGTFAQDNKMGDAGGYLPDGVGVYSKEFTLGKEYNDKKMSLYFEGSYMKTTIRVNGSEVGTHDYGYTSFSFDITSFVKQGNNEIEVIVDNSNQPNCRWYSGSGIYRHVWLIATDAIHLKQWSTYITTPRVSSSMATVNIRTTVQNETEEDKTVLVRADISDDYYVEKTVTVTANTEQEVTLETDIYNPRLWDVTTDKDGLAQLYDATISVRSNNGKRVIDSITETFGIRSIEYTVEDGFRLNGKSLKVFGGCLHHDNGILGAVAFDRAEERKVEMMKAAGFNAVRTSHNPVSEHFLRTCDRLGMMVVNECFDGWYDAKTAFGYHEIIDTHWKDDISAMVLRDRNHPSIICWSIGNEIIERDTQEAVQTAERFSGLCRQLDPTRPVTQALACWNDKWHGQDDLAAQHEIAGYNYLLDLAPEDHERVPERIIWQTESFPRDAYKNWKLVQEHPYIIGDFVWTSIDYLGESSIGRWYYEGDTPGEHWQGTHFPWHGAYCGDIDITGWRKPISYYRQLLFAPETAEEIFVAVKEPDGYLGKIRETSWSVWPTWRSWNWQGWEGKPIEVEVYSKYPNVSLSLNGEEVTTFVRNNQFLTTFTLPYEPGILTAKVATDDMVCGYDTLATAGEPVALRLTADRSALKADGQDLSFVTVEVIDSEGRVCPNAEVAFDCSMSGNATIFAAGNANLQDCDSYKDLTHKTWKGRALVVVRSGRETGKSILNISAFEQSFSQNIDIN